MFDTLSKKSKPCSAIDILIGAKAEVNGSIAFSGGLRVDGKVKGDITAKGQANSTLVLSEQAEINGDVTVPHIVLLGKIRGNVHSSEHIELQPKAEITGDVHYKLIKIAEGAVIDGKLMRKIAETTEKDVVAKLKPVAVPGVGEAKADLVT